MINNSVEGPSLLRCAAALFRLAGVGGGLLLAVPAALGEGEQEASALPARDDFPVQTVRGATVDWDRLGDRTVCVFFFSPRMADLQECLDCVQTLYEEREAANLEVLGVCIDRVEDPDLASLLDRSKHTFPVVIDRTGVLYDLYSPTSIPQAYFFADGWRFAGSVPGYPDDSTPHRATIYTNLLREGVGLDAKLPNDPDRSLAPEVPAFEVTLPDGRRLASTGLRGTPTVLAFVAANCPLCRAQLEFFRTLRPEFGPDDLRFLVVLVSEDVDPAAFRRERDLPFPVVGDPGGTLRRALYYRGSIPDTFVLDGEGRIRFRHTTFDEEQEALYRMELRELTGADNPPLLLEDGPSGVRYCRICHEEEYFDWRLSGHASAMASLVEIGRTEDPECVRCHVVGWGEAGGFDANDWERAWQLQNVQCESCHGAGGPHVGAEPPAISAATCAPCHDEEHSLGFEFDSAVELVNHALELSDGGEEALERAKRLRAERKRELLEPQGAYVGHARCVECHEAQHERWSATSHASAWDRLASSEREDPECRRCHLTGFERRWVAEAETTTSGSADPTGAGVQCEACHGPGEDHVLAHTPEEFRSTVLSLGDKCPECVLRQLCASCHDRENDPDFELERELPAVRAMCKETPPSSSRAH